MPSLPLTNSELVAQVSDEDHLYLSFYSWMLMKSTGYVKCNSRDLGKRALHLIVASRMQLTSVDHKDRNKLNCRRDNLRPCTDSQNQANRILPNTTGFRGVSWHPATQKFLATIWKDRKKKHLGLFLEAEDAARAYDTAAKKTHGSFAVLNFPEET